MYKNARMRSLSDLKSLLTSQVHEHRRAVIKEQEDQRGHQPNTQWDREAYGTSIATRFCSSCGKDS